MKFDLAAEQHYINWLAIYRDTYRAALPPKVHASVLSAEAMDRLAARAAS